MSNVVLDASNNREAIAGVDPRFPARWSPRAMNGDALTFDELAPVFEAARWAPSAFNAQPWRFLYALKGDEHWETFYDLMVEGNQAWAKNAGALIVIVSRKRFEHNDAASITHSFDTGAAWMALALQAHQNGLVAHGMQGFDYAAAQERLNIPEVFKVEAMVALGKPGDLSVLPEAYREREVPSDRKPVAEITINGAF